MMNYDELPEMRTLSDVRVLVMVQVVGLGDSPFLERLSMAILHSKDWGNQPTSQSKGIPL